MTIKSLSSLFSVLFCAFFLSGCGNNDPFALNLDPNKLTPINPAANVATSDDAAFLVLINELRVQNGVGTLTINSSLQSAATAHSAEMDSTDTLAHANASAYDAPFNASGENIACGNKSAVDTFNQWKNSPGHLANMLSPNYQFIGIARAGTDAEVSQKNCPWYWTTDFGGN